MNIKLNGAPHECAPGLTLDRLLRELTGTCRGSAAAVDGEVVPRSEWGAFELLDGQFVEVLTAVQGG